MRIVRNFLKKQQSKRNRKFQSFFHTFSHIKVGPVFGDNVILKYNTNFSNLLNPEELELSKQLLLVDNEDEMSSITKLIKETKPRKNKNLPKFLQILPINNLIKSEVLINPDKNDLPIILSTFTINELKEICQTLQIKAGKTKIETINSLIKEDLDNVISYTDYFKINPIFKNIYKKLSDFSYDYLQKKITNLKEIEFKKVGRLDRSELSESISVNNSSIQNYGYNSVVWYKNNEPFFRILGASINGFSNKVQLLRNGYLSVLQQLRIGDWTLSRDDPPFFRPRLMC